MIVVDTNVLAHLYLPGEHTAAAESLLEQDPEWAAPIPVAQRVSQYPGGHLSRKSLTVDQAFNLQREAESMLEGSEFEVDSLAVLEFVRDSDCSAYDCELVALAAKLGTRLVTLDGKLLRAFPKCAMALA